ncbi:hypothetical protein LINGRAPRIM_LOCUS1684 [Linum grandiflorum]
MKRNGLRVAFEAWNFCNEVGEEAPLMGSPRAADCFDLRMKHHHQRHHGSRSDFNTDLVTLEHKVSKKDNKLGVGKPFPGLPSKLQNDADLYTVFKESYLGDLCQVPDYPTPWHFWTVMLKNGNYDSNSGLCPENGNPGKPFPPGRFPCFGPGCMNQPSLIHDRTVIEPEFGIMTGRFRGSYDLDLDVSNGPVENGSYYEVKWVKRIGGKGAGWSFHHKLHTSKKYPWLMLYLRADATMGLSGGYRYGTKGMMKTLPESPNFRVKLTLDIKKGGGPQSQFYMIDMGSCWKNDGSPCDGDVTTDVTRYSEFVINPETEPWCQPNRISHCPPYHVTQNDTIIYRNDTKNFPYGAYHLWCGPGNAKHLEEPFNTCDPYSNPNAQELVQLLPHPVWGGYGYPTKKGEGWVGDPRRYDLNTGALAHRLYFYQDPGTPPARRIWTSLDVGTEIYVSGEDQVAEWVLSDFDVVHT